MKWKGVGKMREIQLDVCQVDLHVIQYTDTKANKRERENSHQIVLRVEYCKSMFIGVLTLVKNNLKGLRERTV